MNTQLLILIGVFVVVILISEIVILIQLDEVFRIVNNLLTLEKTTSNKHKKLVDSSCEDVKSTSNT